MPKRITCYLEKKTDRSTCQLPMPHLHLAVWQHRAVLNLDTGTCDWSAPCLTALAPESARAGSSLYATIFPVLHFLPSCTLPNYNTSVPQISAAALAASAAASTMSAKLSRAPALQPQSIGQENGSHPMATPGATSAHTPSRARRAESGMVAWGRPSPPSQQPCRNTTRQATWTVALICVT